MVRVTALENSSIISLLANQTSKDLPVLLPLLLCIWELIFHTFHRFPLSHNFLLCLNIIWSECSFFDWPLPLIPTALKSFGSCIGRWYISRLNSLIVFAHLRRQVNFFGTQRLRACIHGERILGHNKFLNLQTFIAYLPQLVMGQLYWGRSCWLWDTQKISNFNFWIFTFQHNVLVNFGLLRTVELYFVFQ